MMMHGPANIKVRQSVRELLVFYWMEICRVLHED